MNNFNNMILITKEKINFLKSLPEYADSRLAQINSKIDNSQDLELHTILQIGIAMNIYFKSLIKSLETKNIIAANILLRSIVESFINIEYIMKEDQQKRSAIFSLEDFKNRKINLETIKELLRAKLNDARITLELSSKKKCNEQLKKIIPIAYSIQLKTIEDIMKKFNLYIEEDFKAMENILKKLQI